MKQGHQMEFLLIECKLLLKSQRNGDFSSDLELYFKNLSNNNHKFKTNFNLINSRAGRRQKFMPLTILTALNSSFRQKSILHF